MVIFGVWQGNNLLSSIQDTIDRPQPNSNCSRTLAEYAEISISYDYYSYGFDYDTCVFSEREIALGLDTTFKQIRPLLTQLEGLQTKESQLQYSISNNRYEQERTVSEYQTSLVEDVAQNTGSNSGVLSSEQLGTAVTSGANTLSSLNRDLSLTQSQINSLKQRVRTIAISHTSALKEIERQYQYELKLHEFITFLVSLILVAPVFYLTWRRYHKAKLERSPYSIIWGGAVASFGLILAQIGLVFIYEILPREIIQAILTFLSAFKALWILVYWLSFILVPVFFGFLIYLIQKKFYNKQAVMMRALKSGQCPECSLRIHHDMNNCPICGYTLKTKCRSCGAMSMAGGSFCSSCGTKEHKLDTSSSNQTQ
jgi:preprotein translocase subunit YajC